MNIQELKRDQKPPVIFGALPWKQHSKTNFKVVTTPDATTLEYYQSIYTHCKQRFNIPDGIEVVKKSVYQYIENPENRSEHSETAANKENNSKISKEKSIDSENKEDKMIAYIAKISEFYEKDIETSLQKWLDQVTKAGDANG
ncbi:hypothetical protein G9A89_011400 [Geosiphon pyriformis]|nr:hypothetical protein G9A89_011400 [Geosiphon pyriformis]